MANTAMRIVSQIPVVVGYVVGAMFAAVPLWGAVAIARRDVGDEYPFVNPLLAVLIALYGMAAGIPGFLAMLRYWPSPLASRRRRLYGAAAGVGVVAVTAASSLPGGAATVMTIITILICTATLTWTIGAQPGTRHWLLQTPPPVCPDCEYPIGTHGSEVCPECGASECSSVRCRQS